MHAPAIKVCDTCGSSLDLEAPSGFCPACLLSTALDGNGAESTAAGASIADYEIVSEIARGGMGIVYRARQRMPVRVVALKMILPVHISSPGAITRFRAEAEAAASLDHPGILPVYAVGENDGAPFYSMKFAEGGSLAARLAAFRDKPRESANLITKLARALAHAHERGILHRDLKPGNILFDVDDKPFVSDFGVAKWLEREGDLTQTLAILGTPFYMAPEQAAGARRLTPVADVYSLGAILFHLLTGRVPFRGDNALEVLRQTAEHPPPRPRALNRNVPADLETICLKCLEKDPVARYSSANALADDVDRFLARRSILARRLNPVTQASRWAQRNPSIALLGAAAIALLISLLLVFFSRKSVARDEVPSKSLAVLPFESRGDEKANSYFVDGIHDDLLANLSKLGQLKVISPNSVLSYKGPRQNLRAIGKALGVTTVLEGTVQRAESHLHIHVRLIDATNDTQLWAESLDREVADVFALQNDLAIRIATALKVTFSPAERAAIEKPPTRDAEAYDFYLRGQELLHGVASLGSREENLSTAIQLLSRAVERDHDFALGYCLLAELHLARFRVSGHNPAELDPVRSNLEITSRLAPDLGEAHLVRGMYFYHGMSDYERASAEFAAARRALPNNAECLHLSGLLERRLGHWSEGLRQQVKGISLDPQSATAREDLAATYYLTRNFVEAELVLDQAIVALPDHANFFRMKKAHVALMKGDLDACRAGLQSLPPEYEYDGMVGYFRALLALHLRDTVGANRILEETLQKFGPKKAEWWVARDQALVARAEGDPAKTKVAFETALRIQTAMREKTPNDPGVNSMIALFHAGLGQKEEALREIQKAVALRSIATDAVDGPAVATTRALVYAWCGEHNRALEQLATLATIPSGPDPGDLKFNPAWDPLRGDPRFDKIIAAASKKIGID